MYPQCGVIISHIMNTILYSAVLSVRLKKLWNLSARASECSQTLITDHLHHQDRHRDISISNSFVNQTFFLILMEFAFIISLHSFLHCLSRFGFPKSSFPYQSALTSFLEQLLKEEHKCEVSVVLVVVRLHPFAKKLCFASIQNRTLPFTETANLSTTLSFTQNHSSSE